MPKKPKIPSASFQQGRKLWFNAACVNDYGMRVGQSYSVTADKKTKRLILTETAPVSPWEISTAVFTLMGSGNRTKTGEEHPQLYATALFRDLGVVHHNVKMSVAKTCDKPMTFEILLPIGGRV